MLSAFYQAEFTQPRYNLPSNKSWWLLTVTYPIIENYKLFFLTLILLTIIYLFFLFPTKLSTTVGSAKVVVSPN